MSASSSFTTRITAQIIDLLNHGLKPWAQPWNNAAALPLPLRHNGTPYRGFNIVALWAAASERQFAHRHWFSFKQAQALGGHVRRGERATHITFYSNTPSTASATPDDDTSDPTSLATPRRAILRSYAVFNAAQIDNLPLHFYATPTPITDCDDDAIEARFVALPAVVQHGDARACYNPATDTIHLPPRHSFSPTAQNFSTWLHELAHWSGHASRLARDAFVTPGPRATAAYAREELIAELTAAFLGVELDLPVDHLEDRAAYLDHWLKILDREPGALLTAASHAQRAADFLRPFLGLTPVVAPDTIGSNSTGTPVAARVGRPGAATHHPLDAAPTPSSSAIRVVSANRPLAAAMMPRRT